MLCYMKIKDLNPYNLFLKFNGCKLSASSNDI